MKIIITPDNWVEITDVISAEEAVTLIKGLRNDASIEVTERLFEVRDNAPVEPKAKRGPRPKSSVMLSPALAKTWKYLIRNVDDAGISPKALADASGLTRANAQFRLEELVKRGAATKVERGRYRAVLG